MTHDDLQALFAAQNDARRWAARWLKERNARLALDAEQQKRQSVPNHDGPYDLSETAALLKTTPKTVRGHMDRDEINYFIIGKPDSEKPRYRFDKTDIESFKARAKETRACRSTSTGSPGTGTSTSKSKVVGFMEARGRRAKGRQGT